VTAAPLAGKLALITGASRGIGLAVADELRVAGAARGAWPAA
jgi:NAD(P)-dependent dehydrogenase (short-subunit alcohol dehydrogenase family)